MTHKPIFKSVQIQLACQACIEAERAHECTHNMHLIPAWHNEEKHTRLKAIMSDRPGTWFGARSGVHRGRARARVHAHVRPPRYVVWRAFLCADAWRSRTANVHVCLCRSDQLRDERRRVLVRQPVLPAARPQAHVRDEPADHVPARPGRARVRRPLRGRRALGTHVWTCGLACLHPCPHAPHVLVCASGEHSVRSFEHVGLLACLHPCPHAPHARHARAASTRYAVSDTRARSLACIHARTPRTPDMRGRGT